MLQSKTGELELSRSVEWDVSGLRHCPARAAVRPNAEGNSIDKLMVENKRRTVFSTGVDVEHTFEGARFKYAPQGIACTFAIRL